MTGQSLKLGKFKTNQVANIFGDVRWPSVISTPGDNFLFQFRQCVGRYNFILIDIQLQRYLEVF